MAAALNEAVALAFELGLVGVTLMSGLALESLHGCCLCAVAGASWLMLVGWLVSVLAFSHIQENRPV